MFAALTRLATRHPKRVVVAAVLLAVAAAVAGSSVADRLDPYAAEDPSTESVRADELLERAGVGAGVDVVALVETPRGAASADGRERVARIERELSADPDVARVTTFEEGGEPSWPATAAPPTWPPACVGARTRTTPASA